MIPEFSQFTKLIEEIYRKCKPNSGGKVIFLWSPFLKHFYNPNKVMSFIKTRGDTGM